MKKYLVMLALGALGTAIAYRIPPVAKILYP